MSNDRSVYNIPDFSRLLVASDLLDDTALELLLDDFHKNFAPRSKYGKSLTGFGTYLVANNILTCWQYDMLRNGQWKGFFLDQYKLIDHVGIGTRCSRYLAEDTTTGKCVVLAITPPAIAPLQMGKPQYIVEPFDG